MRTVRRIRDPAELHAVRLHEQQLRTDLCQQHLHRLAQDSSYGPGATHRALDIRLGFVWEAPSASSRRMAPELGTFEGLARRQWRMASSNEGNPGVLFHRADWGAGLAKHHTVKVA